MNSSRRKRKKTEQALGEKRQKKCEINPEGLIDNKNLIKEIISREFGRQPSQ